MSFRVSCPNCKKTIKAMDSHAGKQINCPGCGQKLNLPSVIANQGAGKSAEAKIDDVVEAVAEAIASEPTPTFGPSMHPAEPKGMFSEKLPPPEPIVKASSDKPMEIKQPVEVIVRGMTVPVGDAVWLIIVFWVASVVIAFFLGLFGFVIVMSLDKATAP